MKLTAVFDSARRDRFLWSRLCYLLFGVTVGLWPVSAQTGRGGNALRMPPNWTGGVLTAAPVAPAIWPGFTTPLLAINGSVPSPTIRVQKGQTFTARIENRLTNNLVMHWHGIVAPPSMDGHPKDAVRPGQNYTVGFPVRQRAGTYFYHPHTEPLTGYLVYRGLAGGFIVEDPDEQSLGLPGGDHDLLLLIQDKRLRADRQIVYEPSMMDMMMGYLGDTVLVNGTPDAYLSADRSLYRLRLVNGSNARVYKLGFSDGRAFHVIATDGGLIDAPVRVTSAFLAPGERVEILVEFSTNRVGDSVTLRSFPFDSGMMAGMGDMAHGHMGMTNSGVASTNMMASGSPGGMPSTNGAWSMSSMGMMAMGTASNHMGGGMEEPRHMVGTNPSPTMASGGMMTTNSGSMMGGGAMGSTTGDGMMTGGMGGGMNMGTDGMGNMSMISTQGIAMDILRFYIDRSTTSSATIPAALSTITRHNPAQARRTRLFTLGMSAMTHTINNTTFRADRVDFQVPFGELEIWEFRNLTDEIHPMHPHGALFQVLDRNGKTNLPPENLGWKDTVLVWPNETVRVLIRFDAYAGLFVSHCHNLEHEDSGMMQNLEVLPARLAIASPDNRLVLSYSALALDYVLEESASLGAGAAWTRLNETPRPAGDDMVLTIQRPTASRFYRLVRMDKPSGQPPGGDPHAGHHP